MARVKSEEHELSFIFQKVNMLTKYRNVLHVFSPTLKRKTSECWKRLSLLTSQAYLVANDCCC